MKHTIFTFLKRKFEAREKLWIVSRDSVTETSQMRNGERGTRNAECGIVVRSHLVESVLTGQNEFRIPRFAFRIGLLAVIIPFDFTSRELNRDPSRNISLKSAAYEFCRPDRADSRQQI